MTQSQTTCFCLACDPKHGEIGLECKKPQTTCQACNGRGEVGCWSGNLGSGGYENYKCEECNGTGKAMPTITTPVDDPIGIKAEYERVTGEKWEDQFLPKDYIAGWNAAIQEWANNEDANGRPIQTILGKKK